MTFESSPVPCSISAFQFITVSIEVVDGGQLGEGWEHELPKAESSVIRKRQVRGSEIHHWRERNGLLRTAYSLHEEVGDALSPSLRLLCRTRFQCYSFVACSTARLSAICAFD